MSTHPELRVGDSLIWRIAAPEPGLWTRERALRWLQDAVEGWPVRGALLSLSGAMLGPDDDLDRALGFLAEAFERGRLVVLPTPEAFWGRAQIGSGEPAWDDVPRLSDLRPPSIPRDVSREADPVVPMIEDPWVTFVAFVIVDQHGKPLTGRSRCSANGDAAHVHAIDGTVVDIRPIAAHARVQLVLEDLAYADEEQA